MVKFIIYLFENRLRVCLVRVFKQQFLVFIEIRVGEKVCENMYNII